MTGVMSVSGYRGSGKSFLAAQADFPENIAVFDFENKGAGIDEQLKFGLYRPLVQECEGDPVKLYKKFSEEIDRLEQDKYTVLIIDNVSPLEVAMNAEVRTKPETYADRYGLNAKNIIANRYGGSKSVVNFMISDFASRIHSKGVKLIIVISHIGNRWSPGGIIPNKYNVKGADRWQELSILTLILIHGKNPPVPSALVQKEQLGTISVNSNLTPEELDLMIRGETGHKITRRLPTKISDCTFQSVRHYLYNPVDFDNLKPDEIPTEEEINPFRERLSKEQFEIVRGAIALKEREEKENEELEALEKQRAYKERATILSDMLDNYDGNMTPKDVRDWYAEQGQPIEMPVVIRLISMWKENNS